MGHACYHVVQNLLSSCLQPNNILITVVLFDVLYESESLTFHTEERLRMFKNRMISKMFCPKTEEITG